VDVEVDVDFVAVRDEVWLLLQRGERRAAALALVGRFWELTAKGKQGAFLQSRIFIEIAVELADILIDDVEFGEEIARQRAAYNERVQKEQQ